MSTITTSKIATICNFLIGLCPATARSSAKKQARFSPPRWPRSLAMLYCLANPLLADQIPDWEYLDTGTSITITRYTGPGGAVTIPDRIPEIAGKPVTVIGEWAFGHSEAAADLTNITFADPSSVTSIGNGAFDGCSGLTSFTIPAAVTQIEDRTFYDCTSLASVTIPSSLTSIGNQAFHHCVSLPDVVIPASVTSIGEQAFAHCIGLAGNIVIPKSVTSIGSGALMRCSSLAAITVDSANASYRSVEGVLFDTAGTTLIQCPGGKQGDFTIPDGVTSITDNAFAHCTSLTSVAIPASVGSVGSGGNGPFPDDDAAFSNCSGLAAITVAPGNTSFSSPTF